jgi:hypothetical protein
VFIKIYARHVTLITVLTTHATKALAFLVFFGGLINALTLISTGLHDFNMSRRLTPKDQYQTPYSPPSNPTNFVYYQQHSLS